MYKFKQYILATFKVDFRSLALMRMCAALLIIYDLLKRSSLLEEHYTDAGVLPRYLLFSEWNKLGYFSFHCLSGDWWYQALLFIISLLVAVALLVGYRTKLSTLLAWVLMLSLHNRNPLILYGGDSLLLLFLFIAMFLPWGEFWSLDSRYKKRGKERSFVGFASVAYILQICCLFWFASVFKIQYGWFDGFDSLYYVLSANTYITPLAPYMLKLPLVVLEVITALIVIFDVLAPLCLFLPIRQETIRTWVALKFIIKHLSVNLFLFLGTFSFVVSVFMIGLLNDRFWEWKYPKKLSTFLDGIYSVKEEGGRVGHWWYGVGEYVSLCFVVLLLWCNLVSVSWLPPLPKVVDAATYVTGLGQGWYMFCPVDQYEYWFTVEGTLYSGEKVNLVNPETPLSDKRPDYMALAVPHERKYSYFIALDNQKLIDRYADYTRLKFEEGNSHLQKTVITLYYRRLLPEYKYGEVEKEILGEYEWKK